MPKEKKEPTMVSSLVKHSSVGEIYESYLTFQLLRTVTEHLVIFPNSQNFPWSLPKKQNYLQTAQEYYASLKGQVKVVQAIAQAQFLASLAKSGEHDWYAST